MSNNQLGKIPPQSVEMEEAVLAALMLDKDAIVPVLSILAPEKFYKDAHCIIYKSIMQLFTAGEPIDLLTVVNKLRKNGELEIAGGVIYITELTSKVSSAENIEYHARIISEQYLKRSIIKVSSEATKMAFTDTEDVFGIMDQISSELIRLMSGVNDLKAETVRSIMPSVLESIKKSSESKDSLTGIDTGYSLLNQMTNGWANGDMILLAARPSMGKTDIALNFAVNAALKGEKVAFFSLETVKGGIVKRIISIVTEVFKDKIKTGRLTDTDWSRIMAISREVLDNIIVLDNPSLSAIKFHGACKTLKMKHGITMVIADYLQLMSGSKKGNRENEVSEISRTCKMIAMDLNIPVMPLSQLSRAVEIRSGDKRPILSDLRESGCLSGDTMIYCPKEMKITPIKDLVGKKFSVVATSDGLLTVSEARKCFPTGKKEIFEMEISSGRKIKATANHKFLTEEGWVELRNLKGKRVAIPINYGYGKDIRKIGFFNRRKNDVMEKGWDNMKNVKLGWSTKKINSSGHLCYYPVKSIIRAGVEEVYDIEVPGPHNFTANGIIVHNSLEQDSDTVIFIYRAEKYGIDTDEDGNSTHNVTELIFAKHRNGKLGTIPLRYIPSIGVVHNIDNDIEDHPKYNPDKFTSSGQNDFDEPKF